MKVSKGAKIRNRYNQVPHPTKDTNGKVTNSQLDTINERQEVNPFKLNQVIQIFPYMLAVLRHLVLEQVT